jgi:hypothetical protein
MFAPCTYTAADGSYFDLSPLTRSNSPQDYVMADAAGNSYILNVRSFLHDQVHLFYYRPSLLFYCQKCHSIAGVR